MKQEHSKPMPIVFDKHRSSQSERMSGIVCLQPKKHDIPEGKEAAAMSDPTMRDAITRKFFEDLARDSARFAEFIAWKRTQRESGNFGPQR